MDRVRQIEEAIASLSPEDYRRLVDWFRMRERDAWDQQIDADSASGKLDVLFEEADRDSEDGLLREWPRSK